MKVKKYSPAVITNQAVVDLTGYLKDSNDAMSNKYKLVDNKFFDDKANVKPTLPGGTYYLVIKDLNEAGKQQNATVVIPVALNEGGILMPLQR